MQSKTGFLVAGPPLILKIERPRKHGNINKKKVSLSLSSRQEDGKEIAIEMLKSLLQSIYSIL